MSESRVTLLEDILANIGAAGTGDGYTRNVSLASSYSIQMVASGSSSPVGITVTVSASNDGTNWIAGTPLAVSGDTTVFLTIPTSYCKFIKLTRARTSGSVAIKAWLLTKEVAG